MPIALPEGRILPYERRFDGGIQRDAPYRETGSDCVQPYDRHGHVVNGVLRQIETRHKRCRHAITYKKNDNAWVGAGRMYARWSGYRLFDNTTGLRLLNESYSVSRLQA